MTITISDIKNADFSNLKVGDIHEIKFEHEGGIIEVPKALIIRVDTEKQEFEYEPLVEFNSESHNYCVDTKNSPLLDIEIKDDKGSVLLRF